MTLSSLRHSQMLPEYRYHLPWKITLCFAFYMVIYRASLGATVKNPPIMQKTQFRSLGQEDSLAKEMATHSSILAWRVLQRSLVDHSPWGHIQTQLTEQHTFHLHFLMIICIH